MVFSLGDTLWELLQGGDPSILARGGGSSREKNPKNINPERELD